MFLKGLQNLVITLFSHDYKLKHAKRLLKQSFKQVIIILP